MSVTARLRAARDLLVEHQQDYAGARAAFEWPRFETVNFGSDWFDAVAATPERADQDALVIVEEDGTVLRRSYARMSADTDRVAGWLQHLGVGRGDTVIVMLDNQVELWEAMLACMKIGAVVIPTTTQLVAADLQDRVDRAGARWAIANAGNLVKFADVVGDCTLIHVPGVYASEAEHALPEVPGHPVHSYGDAASFAGTWSLETPTSADDPLLLYFTSGTTSLPKLVEHTQASYTVGHLSTMYWVGLRPGDVHLNVASPGWGKHAWSSFFAPWLAEATIFVLNFRRFDAATLMRAMDEGGVTSFCAPPTVWRMLIKADLTQLQAPPRNAISAGEPLNAAVIDQVQRGWGVTVRDGFGQTESTLQIANTPGQRVVIGAMGRPLPGFDIELRDPQTGDRVDGEGEGEICVGLDPRPVGLFQRYHGDPEKTAEAFRDGVYHTGDIARRDEHGIYTYVGRADDLFKSSDYKLSPFELESVLMTHPAVLEAAVVPAPDELRLSVPKAFVTLAAGHEPGEEAARAILQHVTDRVPAYKRIRRIEFRPLPKTVSGKVRRVELRAEEEQRRAGVAGLGVEHREEDLGIRRQRRA
ncbi:AMP-binding protein [Micrococcus porci]|uniref:AMP-binding protein n=1 Tax=Micrococcus TaxID=1269 RepID=UPI001CCAA5D9|nr:MULTISPECIES: AMP-binding protein [Micrococcus]MCG7423383.1 AMP-binding protein [Micrococcus sp. ACRRV]UBH24621.1 AMP-binding protein [Micrococcus porci]